MAKSTIKLPREKRFDREQLIRHILWARRDKLTHGDLAAFSLALTKVHKRPITPRFIAQVLRAPTSQRHTLRPPTLPAALRDLERYPNDWKYWQRHKTSAGYYSRRRWSCRLFELLAIVSFLLSLMPDTDAAVQFKQRCEKISETVGRRPRGTCTALRDIKAALKRLDELDGRI